MTDVLLIVALKTDQPNIERRLKTILAAAEPVDPLCHTEPVAWANLVDDLVAADLDALAALVGWDAVSRLRVGAVVGEVSEPSMEAAAPATPAASPADAPADAPVRIVQCGVNGFGHQSHNYPSAIPGTACYCGRTTWDGGLTDA